MALDTSTEVCGSRCEIMSQYEPESIGVSDSGMIL
jgi:hypothetical protein